MKRETVIGKIKAVEDSGELVLQNTVDGKRIKPIPTANVATREQCLEVGDALANLKWEIPATFAEELFSFLYPPTTTVPAPIQEQEVSIPMPATKPVAKSLDSFAGPKPSPTPSTAPAPTPTMTTPSPPTPTTPAPSVQQIQRPTTMSTGSSTMLASFLGRLNTREQQMFEQVCQKFSKPKEEMALYYSEKAEKLSYAPGLLLFRDWRKVGGAAVRRVILMNEGLNVFKFFTEDFYPVNTCIRIITNVSIPFDKGRIIGISNRTLQLNFGSYCEIANGNVMMHNASAEPTITSIEKISETDEIYTKIPRAEDVLSPFDPESSLQKAIDLTKAHSCALEEVVHGVIQGIYPTEDGRRYAVHIGDAKVNANRVTCWFEANRGSLNENDLNRIARVYGYITHKSQEYKGQIQDNLDINIYHMVLEA